MRKLDTEKRAAIVHALVEGNSINSTCHMTGARDEVIVLGPSSGSGLDSATKPFLFFSPRNHLRAFVKNSC